jgi:hypothetical protein
VPTRPTPFSTIPTTTGRLAVLVLALLAAGIAAAPAALAVDDATRPDATVTRGPSCAPGGVAVEVTAGTAPYAVVLATTRHPEGEDSAMLAPGQTVLLRTGDVDWGETIDSRLLYTAGDGSGVSYADELDPFTFTRPAEEDCAAIGSASATAPATVPTPMSSLDGGGDTPPGAGDDTPPAAGGDPSPGAGVVPADGGGDLQLQSAAAERPVAPVTRTLDWPAVVAGAALLASAAGLAVTGLRRRRGSPPAGA